ADMQWRTPQDLGYENHMIPFPPAACNPYWGGMPLGMEGYMGAPFMGNMGNMGNMSNMPYMGYNPGPFDGPFGGLIPQDPFAGQGYMMPVVQPQRDLAEIALGSSQAPPIMSREEFEARKADLRRKREMERRSEREYFNDGESVREMSNSGDISSMKAKSHQRPSNYPSSLQQQSQYSRQNHHHHRSEKPPLSSTERLPLPLQHQREANLPARSGKRRLESEEDAAAEAMVMDKKHKASVFSRISFPELNSSNPPIKKKKSSSSTSEIPSTKSSSGYKDYDPPTTSSTHSHHHHRSSSHHHHQRDESKSVSAVISNSRKSSSLEVDQDSSDEDRHFKRRPSRYEPPPPPIEDEVVVRSSRRSRERDHYEREHRHSKHR
ncbi:hypothetical protein MKX01_013861, partial [Papaver californicum]